MLRLRQQYFLVSAGLQSCMRSHYRRFKTFDNFAARMIQHEFSHLDGVLFTDLVAPIRRKLIGRKLQGISAGKVATHYKSTLKK